MEPNLISQMFLEARTHAYWQDKPVNPELLQQLYDLTKMGPTSANCCPLRITFITTPEAKARLKPCLAEGNIEKTMAAPVTAILAYDTTFYEKLPTLFPHTNAKAWFVGNETLINDTAFRNSSLQGGYFILAARSLGLDCGPMSGFDHDTLNNTFFKDTSIKANFLCNLGYGDIEKLHPRQPRLTFDETCKIL